MNLPSVAIIIPTRNRTALLKRCLSKLVPYVASHPECSITVSDDGDAAVTREALAEEMGIVQVKQGPCRGPAANRNWGAAHSTGELLVFLDDDCIPEENLISTYQEAALKEPGIGVFEGRISSTGKASGFADTIVENETGGYLWPCNFAVRRSLFEKVGGFDERYPFAAAEDAEFHLRVKRETSIPFLSAARVWHDPERRIGWRVVKHKALSDLLYLHISGVQVTRRRSFDYARMAAQYMFRGGWRQIRAGATKDPMQLILQCTAFLELSLIAFAWRFHRALARVFYPPCCPGCESIHALLATPASPLIPHEGDEGSAPNGELQAR